MSKLSRTVLKEIVKECIIEIFEESFFTPGSLVNESSNRRKTKHRRASPRQNRKLGNLDNVRYNNSSNSNISEHVENKFDRKVDTITANLTNDPVMANIFKDTAKTTLQQQNTSSARSGMVVSGGDEASMQVSQSDPTELFAESAGKWATLAFAESIKR